MKNIVLIFIFCLLFVSCSKSDTNNEEEKDTTLTGTVAGQPFTFMGGKAYYASASDKDQELIWVYLTNITADCSSSSLDFDLGISARIPFAVGKYTDINIVTTANGETPFNSLNETVEITAVSATEISGKIKLVLEESTLTEESIFSGSFTVSVCQ